MVALAAPTTTCSEVAESGAGNGNRFGPHEAKPMSDSYYIVNIAHAGVIVVLAAFVIGAAAILMRRLRRS
jgi:hypothetical protein